MRSSNSSAPESGPFWFLERCLDALEKETPVAYGLVVRALGARAIAIDIEGDVVRLSIENGRHRLSRDVSRCAVEMTLTEAVIGRLLEARCTILDAVLGGDVALRGSADDLAALHDALLAFIQGAVRSPSTPRLFDSFLRRITATKGRAGNLDDNHGERHDVLQK